MSTDRATTAPKTSTVAGAIAGNLTVMLPAEGPSLTPGLARALLILVTRTAERRLSTSALPPAA